MILTAIFMAPVEEGSVWPLVFLFGGPLVFVIAVVSALYYGLRRVVSQKVFRPINDRIAKKALADRDRLEKRREPEVLLYIAGLANQENRTMHPDDFSSKYVHKLEDMLALAEERDAFIQHLSSFSQSRHYEPAQRTIAKVKAGDFEPEDYGPYSFMAHGGGSLAPMDDKLVPQAVQEKVQAKRQEILDGLFRVNVNDSEPKSTM